jgi:serine/threonine-protein kinase RsbW
VRVQVTSDAAGLVRAVRAARAYAERCALAETAADRLCVVVEEWLTNVLEHGEPVAGSRLRVEIRRESAALLVTVSDAGVPFDPRSAGAYEGPNLDRGGGAGLELVRAWSEIADYSRRRGRNRVVLVVAAS